MLDVKLLGQFEVQRDSNRLTIPTRNAQSLFAFLVLNAKKTHRREHLAGLLWPDSDEENARSNLRHELWRLRKAVEITGSSYFQTDDLAIAFHPQNGDSMDVQQLECVRPQESTPEDLMQALAAYRGELLPGFQDEWIVVERTRLYEVYEARMARLLELLQNEERWAEVLTWGKHWAAAGLWPEPAYRAMMLAYASTGDRSKAVAVYERLSQGLQKDLGIGPSEQTQALYLRMKTGERPGGQRAALTQAPQLTPSSGNNAAPAAFPFLKIRRSNLPKPLTSFVGREKEILEVEQLVSTTRLVTITGAGGVGKTRLAIQVAAALSPQFTGGVRWIPLATLSQTSAAQEWDPSQTTDARIPPTGPGMGEDLVTQAVASDLRVSEAPDQSLLQGILDHLHDQTLLLILDNCEHLIEACAALVERVLADCPAVKILATSREGLGVPGEKAWRLPSLSLPGEERSSDIQKILQSEAVSLFIARAADVLPGYQPAEHDAPTIAQICLHLDGIPLAIELAAARMNLLSPQEIAARLDRRFSLLTGGFRTALLRHQTLRAAIEWSYDLLSASEQVLCRRLSIFAGSFSMEAAEAICSSQDLPGDQVLTMLGRLVDKSLLNVEPAPQDTELTTRYRFLDTIRSFGRLKLEEANETRWMHDHHADYYVKLVEAGGPELLLQNQVHWYKLLVAENDNLRAVVDWSAESDQAEIGLRVVGALLWFWWSHGSSREGRDLTLNILALPSANQLNEFRARALNTAGYLHWVLGDMDAAIQKIEEALSILRQSDDKASLAWSMQILGMVLISKGEYDLADQAMKEGVAISEELKDYQSRVFSLAFQGDIAMQQEDHSKARKVYEESAELLRAFGNMIFQAYPLRRLGYLNLEQNDLKQAYDCFRQSLHLNHDVGDKRAVAACLTGMAALAVRLGQPMLATRLYGAVESRLDSLYINLLPMDQAEQARIRGKLLTILNPEAFAAAFGEGWEMNDEQAIELTEGIYGRDDKQESE